MEKMLTLKEWDADPSKYEFFYNVKKHPKHKDMEGMGHIRRSNIVGALVSAAAAIRGNAETGLEMKKDVYNGQRNPKDSYSKYEESYFNVEDTTEAIRITKEVFRNLKKKADILGDITLNLAIDKISEALDQIILSTQYGRYLSKVEFNKYIEDALPMMRDAEEKAMRSFYESVKDKEAIVQERLDKTTISLQLAIFCKILIPSFRLDRDTGADIGIVFSLQDYNGDYTQRHIAKNLKALLDNLLNTQSRLKAKGWLPPGAKREHVGKFQEMVEFFKKILYPYFMWGAGINGDVFEEYSGRSFKGNNPLESFSYAPGGKLLVMSKYLGLGRNAACQISISSAEAGEEVFPFISRRWGGSVSLNLWRGETAIFGTSIEGRSHEEQLVLYHPLTNDNMEVQVDILGQLGLGDQYDKYEGNKYGINGKRNKEKMIFLGLEDVTNPLIIVDNMIPKQGEDCQQKGNEEHLKLVPKDFPTWSSDRLPIYTNVWVVVDPRSVAKPALPIVQYMSRNFHFPKPLKREWIRDCDGEGYWEGTPDVNAVLWPWKPVVLNIWRGDKALFGTVCGVLVFIQPFQDKNEEINFDVHSLKRHCDWMNLENDEIKPSVNVNANFLNLGFEKRCPIILGDLPKHKEDLPQIDLDGYGKRKKNAPFWQGFLFSGCPEVVIEIWIEDGHILGILPGTDIFVMCSTLYDMEPLLTLKDSLKSKPYALGDILLVSPANGKYMEACGLYIKNWDKTMYQKLTSIMNRETGEIITYKIINDKETGWQITGDRTDKAESLGPHPTPPITGWTVNEQQLNVTSLGQTQSRAVDPNSISITVGVYALPNHEAERLPVVLEVDEEDVPGLQKALDYNFWAGWMAGGGRKLEMKLWIEKGYVVATYADTADVVFFQRLQDEDTQIVISFARLRNVPIKLGKRKQKEFSSIENAPEIVKFESTGEAAVHLETRMGTYAKTQQTITKAIWPERGPVVWSEVKPFKSYVYHQESSSARDKYYLYFGQGEDDDYDCWRVGPDVNYPDRDCVLKNRGKNEKMPPKSGWLYYLNGEWHEDESLQLVECEPNEVSDESEDNKEDLKMKMDQLFDCFDVESDKFITTKGFLWREHILGCTEKDDSEEDKTFIFDLLMAASDQDKDGKLNYEEFCDMNIPHYDFDY